MASKNLSMEGILSEIQSLRMYMHEVSQQVDSLNHPLLVEVSQMLDKKLNQHQRMLNHR